MAEITTRVEREASTVGLRINASNTKLMVVGSMSGKRCIMAEGQIVETIKEFCYLGSIIAEDQIGETVEEFCYLGSVISDNSNCEKDIKTRLGKVNSVFGRLNAIWKSRHLNCNIKIRLYESLVLSTLKKTWSMTVT